jgi:hypothetical protein
MKTGVICPSVIKKSATKSLNKIFVTVDMEHFHQKLSGNSVFQPCLFNDAFSNWTIWVLMDDDDDE